MEHKVVRLPSREKIAELKSITRDRAIKVIPWAMAAGSILIVAELQIGGPLRFGSKAEIITNAAVFAVPLGVKVFKAVKRSISRVPDASELHLTKLSQRKQTRIARSDSFEHKSALLNSPHITTKTLTMIRRDYGFIHKLHESMNEEEATLIRLNGLKAKYPTSHLLETNIEDSARRMKGFEQNFSILFDEHELLQNQAPKGPGGPKVAA